MNGHEPSLSVIIPWCNRPELAQTLRHNQPIFAAHDAELVIVNCGGDGAWLRHTLVQYPAAQLHWVDLPAPTFNKGLALNLGASVARAPYLFCLDTDILLADDCLPQALNLLAQPCVVSVDRVSEAQPSEHSVGPQLHEIAYVIELVGPAKRTVRIETNRIHFAEHTRSGPGLVFVNRTDFIAVDGMNAELTGWGWEDLDLLVRLELVLGLPRWTAGSVVHLTHGDQQRTVHGPSRGASEQANFAACLANYSLGHYLGTYSEDIATWQAHLVLHTANNP